MNCVPVIERELRVRSRGKAGWLFRLFVAAVGMIVVFVSTLLPYMRPDHQSLFMLVGCAVTGMIVTQLSGCFFTADCVSSEKREGTLGLLFLTPLSSRDIVLGKLASHSLMIFFGVLALAPVLFIPLLNGGVSVGQTMRLFLAVVVSLFLSLSVGIWMSVLGRETRSTVFGTLTVMVLINALPALYLIVASEVFRVRDPGPWGAPQFAPWALVPFAFDDMAGRFGQSLYWIAIGLQTCMGAGALWAAQAALAGIARRGDSDAEPAAGKREQGVWRRCWRWLTSAKRRQACRLGHSRPYQWVAERGWSEAFWLRWFRRLLWLGFLLTFFGSVAGSRLGADNWLATSFCFMMALHVFTKLQVAFEATRQLSRDRREGSLELVLATPLDPRMIVRGVAKATRKVCGFRVGCLAVMNVVVWGVAMVGARRYHLNGDTKVFFTIALLGGAFAAVSDFRAMNRWGAFLALRTKTHLKAALRAMLEVVVAPWIALVFALVSAGIARADEEAVMALLAGWFVACGTWNALRGGGLSRRLDSGFRELVAEGA